MHPPPTRVLLALVLLALGFVGGWVLASWRGTERMERLVAVRWGDGRYGPAFYGAQVYLEPRDTGYSVHARVELGRGNGYFHDLGELGQVGTPAEAVQRFGDISWREDGLHIGDGTRFPVFLERARLEAHR